MAKSRNDSTTGGAGIAPRLFAIILALALWQLVSASVGSDLLLAGPLSTLRTFWALALTPAFWGGIAFSLVRVLAGLALAFVLALALAPLSRRNVYAQAFLDVVVGVIKSVPIVCMVVLLLIWFGSRNIGAVAALLVAFPPLYFSLVEGLGQVREDMDTYLRLSRVSAWRRIALHTWPSLLPMLCAAAKSAAGMAWKAGVAAELIGMPLGSIGERIYQTKLLLMTGELFSWTIAIVIISALTEKALLSLLKASGSTLQRLACRCAEHDVDPGAQSASCAFHEVVHSFDDGVSVGPFSCELAQIGRLCLMGRSGSGKTTLLRMAAGLIDADSGNIELAPDDARVSMLFQESLLFEELDAIDNVAAVAGASMRRDSIRSLLLELLDSSELERPVSELSGGQRRRVELARTLALPSDIVILDEPFASLDADSLSEAARFVDAHLGRRTLIASTHRPEAARLLGAQEMRLD